MLAEFHFENNYLQPHECEMFIDYYDRNEDSATRSLIRQPPYTKLNLARRISKTLIIDKTDEQLVPIIQRVLETVKAVNENQYMFNVDWQSQNHRVHILKYDGVDKGFWGKHQNVNWISNDKQFKIYVSINLSEANSFEGGDLIWFFSNHKDKPTPVEQRQQGLLTVIPAFRAFQVNPVLTGTKYTLEFEYEGPYWR